MKKTDPVRQHISNLLTKAEAHVDLESSLKDFPAELRGRKPEGGPHTPWQLLEHIRIAQWDMMRFCKDVDHKSPKWPDEFWPKETAPEDDDAWNGALKQIDDDLDEIIELLEHSDIYQPLEHGDGQSILREALQIADHNAYHIGEIIMIRRLLGDWKS